jgi:general secretion pathway protein K
MLADYQAAGLDYGPPGAPLETIDELRLVLGLTPEIFGRILPHLTLFGPGSPSKTSADSVVAAALADLLVQERGPSAFDPPPDILVARINAIAYGANHALATRQAVSRVGQLFSQGYQLLAWSDGAVVD